ncbi:DgyrCDS5638 [Dimorphilus gyrociliatus]|uniref:DgyrCDS5638 n=1 Tax=Dimorphilus gyrociliatus TaxID=2664684 RepID=A0A7I8VKH8_9ANNE|nr:DgyrCDS5638 [Dimorphilus gyrociliatus]
MEEDEVDMQNEASLYADIMGLHKSSSVNSLGGVAARAAATGMIPGPTSGKRKRRKNPLLGLDFGTGNYTSTSSDYDSDSSY